MKMGEEIIKTNNHEEVCPKCGTKLELCHHGGMCCPICDCLECELADVCENMEPVEEEVEEDEMNTRRYAGWVWMSRERQRLESIINSLNRMLKELTNIANEADNIYINVDGLDELFVAVKDSLDSAITVIAHIRSKLRKKMSRGGQDE